MRPLKVLNREAYGAFREVERWIEAGPPTVQGPEVSAYIEALRDEADRLDFEEKLDELQGLIDEGADKDGLYEAKGLLAKWPPPGLLPKEPKRRKKA